ncbi:MAG TPA: iron-sulfur cluster assembly protein [Bacteroidales bacterium]|jgi:FeS assembly SUF system protein|nr:iron-sulfur cluster assembly protein [Bacteroidales bacterium]
MIEPKSDIERDIILALQQVFDPEIPVNIYELGLVYGLEVDKANNVTVTMTLTSPNCPAADQLVEDVKTAVEDVPKVADVDVKIVFEPEWNMKMMSEAALLELGML